MIAIQPADMAGLGGCEPELIHAADICQFHDHLIQIVATHHERLVRRFVHRLDHVLTVLAV